MFCSRHLRFRNSRNSTMPSWPTAPLRVSIMRLLPPLCRPFGLEQPGHHGGYLGKPFGDEIGLALGVLLAAPFPEQDRPHSQLLRAAHVLAQAVAYEERALGRDVQLLQGVTEDRRMGLAQPNLGGEGQAVEVGKESEDLDLAAHQAGAVG